MRRAMPAACERDGETGRARKIANEGVGRGRGGSNAPARMRGAHAGGVRRGDGEDGRAVGAGGQGEAACRCQRQVRDLPDDEGERAARKPLLHGPGDVGGPPHLDDEDPGRGQAQACEPRPIHAAKLA